VKQLRGVVEFSQEDLQSRLALLDKFEAQFKQQLAELQESSAGVERQWLEARRELENSNGKDDILAEKVATLKLARELQQEQTSLVKEAAAYLGLVRTYWRRRYELANGRASVEDIRRMNFGIWVAGVERRVMRATSPQTGNAWGLATRHSWLDPSHPCRKAGAR
jgi:hypothetical protein